MSAQTGVTPDAFYALLGGDIAEKAMAMLDSHSMEQWGQPSAGEARAVAIKHVGFTVRAAFLVLRERGLLS